MYLTRTYQFANIECDCLLSMLTYVVLQYCNEYWNWLRLSYYICVV